MRLLLLVVVLMFAGPARGADLMVTAGAGYGGVYEPLGCLDGQTGCDEGRSSGSMLLGLGLSDVSPGGVRGALRLEGARAFGEGRGHYANLLGTVGWQGERLVLEAGLGATVLGSVDASSTRYEPGGMFHGGLGVRLTPETVLLARADLLGSERLHGLFLGLTLEWLPFRSAR
jgi:hypothetical protein